jgi:hypothetical protein
VKNVQENANAEGYSEAKAHYEARIANLEAALSQSAEWFQQYADSHTAKGDTDKAKRNQDRADAAIRALKEPTHD